MKTLKHKNIKALKRIVSAILLGLAAYALVFEIVESYRWAGLAGIIVLILSVIVWNIIYGRFFGL